MDQSSLLLAISHQYLASRDFNGLPLRKLSGDEHKKTRSSLRKLVEKGLVSALDCDAGGVDRIAKLVAQWRGIVMALGHFELLSQFI